MVSSFPGNVFIVAAPSGGGKTSLVKTLLTSLDHVEVSVSHTTREMRPGEKEGVDYFFVSQERFFEILNENGFIEHANVFGHYYGTSVAQINARLAAGIDVILDIDWQGAQQIRRIFPEAVSIFIVPPSVDVLKQRLQARGQDNETVIEKRMQGARDEMMHFSEFEYLIVNDEFDRAAEDLQAIVRANRLKLARQSARMGKLLSFLLSSQ